VPEYHVPSSGAGSLCSLIGGSCFCSPSL
jgi:hypothetical protein